MVMCVCQSGSGFWEKTTSRHLTPKEEDWARRVAERRHERSYGRDRDTVYRKARDVDYAMHLMGARAELAWCILEGVRWPASVDAHRRKDPPPDVPPDIEIRCRDEKWVNIIIRERDLTGDKIHRRFVSAKQLSDGRFEFDGWILGTEAIRTPLRDKGRYGRPAHFINVRELHRLPFYRGLKRHKPPKESP